MSPKLLTLSRFQRPFSFRSHLIAALLITMVPLFIFSVVTIYLLAQNDRATFQRGATQRTLALLTAVDAELKSSITTLAALATSRYLENDDLHNFYDEAARVLKAQPDWFTINLALPDGQQVINFQRPFGDKLPMIVERPSFAQVLQTQKPSIGNLSQGPVVNRHAFTVRVPVVRNGVTKYVLSAVVNPNSISALLALQRLPPDWIGAVLDGNSRFVTRTVDPERNLGQLASESLRSALDHAPEGWFEGRTIQGRNVYTAYTRSPFSGWTVALGIPASAVEASFHRSLLYMASFGIMFLAFGVALAWFISTRTAKSIGSLASVASDLGSGKKAAGNDVPDHIAEVEQVKESLLNAGRLIHERSEERDRVAAALLQVTERLELAQVAGNIGTFERDLITDEIKWSASQEKLYGFSPGSFGGRPEDWAKHVHPEDISVVEAAVLRAKETKGALNIEFRVIHPDGAVRWIASQARVFADDKGVPRRMLGVNIDITERKRVEQRLQLQSAAGRILAESSALGEAAPKIIQALCELAGWDIGAIWEVDRTADELSCVAAWHLPSIDVLEFQAATRQSRFAPGVGLVGRVWSNGQPTWLPDVTKDSNFPRAPAALKEGLHAGVCFPIKLGAEILGAIECYSREIRQPDPSFLQMLATIGHQLGQFIQRRRAEEALRESDRRKDEFLAVLGHELRNPLGVISTAIQIQRRKGQADPESQELQDTIGRQADQMARLLDDLLDVSRIGRGQIRLKKEPCDFTEIVSRTVEDHRGLLKENRLDLLTELPDEPLWVMGDRTRLAQIVGNTLYNANKFTDPGGSVTVRLAKQEQGKTCLLTVRDTGIGMEPEILARAFEPFSQAEQSIDRNRGGLGLGLALVKGLVELQEGEVSIASNGAGQGVELMIRFPLTEAPAQAIKPVEPMYNGNGARTCRILIIEDNQVAARSTRMFLAGNGHTVEVAHDGQTGIETARRFRPEVVLCDIGLPVMDGYAVCQALRQEPGLGDAYLIAITGYGQEEDERRARDVGFDAHLTKPVNLDDVERLLSELTEQQSKVAL
jgi:PAS domain S-box-containing protein